MLHVLVKPISEAASSLVAPALVERATLWINHLLASEPAASQRLQAHAGRSIRIEPADPPTWMPPSPQLVFCITRAGLLEWRGGDAAPGTADLLIRFDASNPARRALDALGGRPMSPDIQGDSALAADVAWLAQNLRWDLADDLERVVGPVPAREIARLAGAASTALRRLAGAVASRVPTGSGGPAPR